MVDKIVVHSVRNGSKADKIDVRLLPLLLHKGATLAYRTGTFSS